MTPNEKNPFHGACLRSLEAFCAHERQNGASTEDIIRAVLRLIQAMFRREPMQRAVAAVKAQPDLANMPVGGRA
jgi:hypothetical protein